MASILENFSEQVHAAESAAAIDAAEFEEAQHDPRLRRLIDEAETYIAELEKSGRNG